MLLLTLAALLVISSGAESRASSSSDMSAGCSIVIYQPAAGKRCDPNECYRRCDLAWLSQCVPEGCKCVYCSPAPAN
ncbi:hypothetical protein GUJ93_ZPchr0005g16239 [Zizania palustris]|uniref:Knottin scorpion toxin-like domain-containing protein n=1 Tax=Zizania palustris TaxID=103762 RepID=A0A8J5VH94_ZIZPA|nr:hypothetical protein GUJ93_ZPchr0005g16239 [Zizania palustris]